MPEWCLTDGGRTTHYSWGQTQSEVHVYIPVPPDTPASAVHVRVTPHTLLVALKGAEERIVVQGGLSRAVCADGSFWMVEGERKDTVHVYLDKVEADVMWSAVIEGDVDADAGANLLVAAREGRASDVVRLLRAKVDVHHTDSANGFTALHWAAACGQLEVLAVLLDLAHSLDVNRPDKVGDTPLLVAVQNMQTKAALALIEAKADVNARNRLLSATPLMIAAGVGELTLVKVLLQAGAEVDAQDSGGLTAAMHAAKMGNSAVVVMLIQQANVDLSLRCKQGKTAHEWAADQPTADTLAENSIFLQAHGAEFI